MNTLITIKPLTKLHPTCPHCGLSQINCICSVSEKTETQVQFWILSSRREFYRPSNTARLMQVINPHATEVFLWERNQEPEALVERLRSGEYDVYLLFPAETEALQARSAEYRKGGRRTAFILLDGTWSEARRILRKSAYLDALPIVSLEGASKSAFDLRKGAGLGEFCTIEAAMAVLRLCGEAEAAEVFRRGFRQFVEAYKASACGHAVRLGAGKE